MHESCGVFGVYYPGEDIARLSFFALFALQHRGQESAGIAGEPFCPIEQPMDAQVNEKCGAHSELKWEISGRALREKGLHLASFT